MKEQGWRCVRWNEGSIGAKWGEERFGERKKGRSCERGLGYRRKSEEGRPGERKVDSGRGERKRDLPTENKKKKRNARGKSKQKRKGIKTKRVKNDSRGFSRETRFDRQMLSRRKDGTTECKIGKEDARGDRHHGEKGEMGNVLRD